MTNEELKNKISQILDSEITSKVYFVLKENASFVIKLADIENKADPEILEMFSNYLRNNIVEKEDLQICELSTADERVGAIYHYDSAEYPDELGVFSSFNYTEFSKSEVKFDFKKDDLGKLFGYIIYLGDMYNGITMFKKHYSISLIKRDSFLLGVCKSRNRFEKVSGEDIVRLNDTVQIVKIENDLFVTDLAVFEKNMGYSQLIQKDAIDAVNQIEGIGIVENIETLKDSTEDSNFARRLSKIKDSSPIFKLHITKETIISFTKIAPGLSGKFKYNEDGTMIRLDTKKSKDLFIKLMNDSFLRSELTKQFYETTVKDNLIVESQNNPK